MLQNRNLNSLPSDFSCKTIPCNVEIPDLKQKMARYFLSTNSVYERLFSLIKNQREFFKKHEPLRHPLVFYYGHTSSFFVNKLLDKGLISKRINESYERIFAVGVDEYDWDDLNQDHYEWPTIPQVQKYRQDVRDLVLSVIQKCSETKLTWDSDFWVVLMGIEHERIHLETSAVIIRRIPAEQLEHPKWFKECPHVLNDPERIPNNQLRRVPQFKKKWNRQTQSTQTYGWDSQYGNKSINIKEFYASEMLVSNGEYLEFVQNGGYLKKQFWNQQAQNWLKSTKTLLPVFWIVKENQQGKKIYKLKTLTRQISMPWDWPVEVNNFESEAFCNWKSMRTGKNLRLPTQDEYFAIRNLLSEDLLTWKRQSVGNINLEMWISPSPVNLFKTEDFYDIIGNVWQQTSTPIYTFDGFKIHPIYEDFSTPTFDGRHYLIKGGSFISTGNEALYHARYCFRRHFYQFAGFRYVQSTNPQTLEAFQVDQSDIYVEKAMISHFSNPKSYIHEVLRIVNQNINRFNPKGNSLVIGCSVGRLPLELTKIFQYSYGIDYTARYFQMASRLIQKQHIKYCGVKVCFKDLDLFDPESVLKRVRLYQMNPENMDQNKINNIDFLILDGAAIRPNTIRNVFKDCLRLFRKKNQILMLVISNKDNRFKEIDNLLQKNQIFEKFSTVNEFKEFGADIIESEAECRLIKGYIN